MARFGTTAGLVALLSASLLPRGRVRTPALLAQRNQPIYPAYDGFLKNPDGSYTLAFAYFSHNAEPVHDSARRRQRLCARSRRPAAADGVQAGHWRFQCVMVVGPDFDGKMRWTLTYAGTTTGTSERMLQSNWNLVEGAAELGRIDYRKGAARRLPEPRADRPPAGQDRAQGRGLDRRHDGRGTDICSAASPTKACLAARISWPPGGC